eukprot:1159838-Pelagomonas_calceolata.AAC.1
MAEVCSGIFWRPWTSTDDFAVSDDRKTVCKCCANGPGDQQLVSKRAALTPMHLRQHIVKALCPWATDPKLSLHNRESVPLHRTSHPESRRVFRQSWVANNTNCCNIGVNVIHTSTPLAQERRAMNQQAWTEPALGARFGSASKMRVENQMSTVGPNQTSVTGGSPKEHLKWMPQTHCKDLVAT